jgi:hypothetical protein
MPLLADPRERFRINPMLLYQLAQRVSSGG